MDSNAHIFYRPSKVVYYSSLYRLLKVYIVHFQPVQKCSRQKFPLLLRSELQCYYSASLESRKNEILIVAPILSKKKNSDKEFIVFAKCEPFRV